MALIRNGELVEDTFTNATALEVLPASGPVIVSLEQWQRERESLAGRGDPFGVRLKSDEPPERIAADLEHFALVALEFPKFRDGRAYSYARLLRERYGYEREIRAVGDVLLEQLFFMLRSGFDAFELKSADPLADYETAIREFSVWYQPTGDGRSTAMQLRRARRA